MQRPVAKELSAGDHKMLKRALKAVQ